MATYQPPGVKVTETTTQSLTPLLATLGDTALVGYASGFISLTSVFAIATSGTAIPFLPAGSTFTSGSIVSIFDLSVPSVSPTSFVVSTDFTFNATTGTITPQTLTNTTTGSVSSGANTLTLSSGAVPQVGVSFTLNQSSNTDVVTVTGISGQTINFSPAVSHSYTSGATATWFSMPNNHTYSVSFTYTPADYFLPVRLTNMADVEQRFGTAWNIQNSPTSGTPAGTLINTPLSFAASMVLQNGASDVVLQPLFVTNPTTGVQQSPTPTQVTQATTWSQTYNNLLNYSGIDIIVPVIGQSFYTGSAYLTNSAMSQIEQATATFVATAKTEDQLFIAIIGEDGTVASTTTNAASITANAASLASANYNNTNQQVVFVNSCQFNVPSAGGTLDIGGQYVAASIAGMLAARSPSSSLTRQTIGGISSINNADLRTLSQKNADAGNGMLVVENNGGGIWIRHAITMDNTSAATRELNVVRAKQYVVDSVGQTLNTQVVGKVIADSGAPTLVNNLVIGILTDLQANDIIVGFSGVQSALTSFDPTTMLVQFTYQPAFIVNYVTVTFSLDLSAGQVSSITTS